MILNYKYSVSVDPIIYNLNVIFKVCYVFSENYFLYIAKTPEDKIKVSFTPKAKDELGEAVEGVFLNQLIDFRVRDTVEEKTSGIRETLYQTAFMEMKGYGKQ